MICPEARLLYSSGLENLVQLVLVAIPIYLSVSVILRYVFTRSDLPRRRTRKFENYTFSPRGRNGKSASGSHRELRSAAIDPDSYGYYTQLPAYLPTHPHDLSEPRYQAQIFRRTYSVSTGPRNAGMSYCHFKIKKASKLLLLLWSRIGKRFIE